MIGEGTHLLSSGVTSLASASKDRDPRLGVSEGPAVLGCEGRGVLRVLAGGLVAVGSLVLRVHFQGDSSLRVCWLSLSTLSLTLGATSILWLGDFPVVTQPCSRVVPGRECRAVLPGPRRSQWDRAGVWE